MGLLAFEQHADPPTTGTAALARDPLHRFADLRMVRRAFAPNRLGIDTDQPARPALRDVMIPHRPQRRITPRARAAGSFPEDPSGPRPPASRRQAGAPARRFHPPASSDASRPKAPCRHTMPATNLRRRHPVRRGTRTNGGLTPHPVPRSCNDLRLRETALSHSFAPF